MRSYINFNKVAVRTYGPMSEAQKEKIRLTHKLNRRAKLMASAREIAWKVRNLWASYILESSESEAVDTLMEKIAHWPIIQDVKDYLEVGNLLEQVKQIDLPMEASAWTQPAFEAFIHTAEIVADPNLSEEAAMQHYRDAVNKAHIAEGKNEKYETSKAERNKASAPKLEQTLKWY